MDAEDKRPEGRRISQLPLAEQDKALSSLHEEIDRLTDRLEAVLSPLNDAPGKSGETAEPSLSPLAEQLRTNNAIISRATRRIDALMERLEC